MGGWNAGSASYSKMVSTFQNRKEFVASAITWLRTYDFDGIDMDWEYPARRGGSVEDYQNFPKLLKVYNYLVVFGIKCLKIRQL